MKIRICQLFGLAMLCLFFYSCAHQEGSADSKKHKSEQPEQVISEEKSEEIVFEDQALALEEEIEIEAPRTAEPPPPPPPPPPAVIEEVQEIYTPQPTQPMSKWEADNYEYIAENDFESALETPLSTFSIDVDQASYSNCRRMINRGVLPPKSAVRIEEFINYFDYDYSQPDGDRPFSISSEMADCPWNKEHKLLHIGLQGKELEAEVLPANNLVFLIDVSGSMQSRNKLPLLKNAFHLLTNELREADKVAIVVYAGSSGVVLPSTSGDQKSTIINAIDQLRAGGSTAGASGIKLAYDIASRNFIQDGNNRVILATDGDFNVGMSSDNELVKLIEQKRESGIFLSVLGFGTGNFKDAKMEKLADNGNGNYAYIDNILEAKKVLVNEFAGTLFTIAKDVKIQIEFNPSKVQEYRLIGYGNRLLDKEDFNDDTKDAGEIGLGHTVTALYEIIPAGKQSTSSSKVDPLKYQSHRVKPSAMEDPDWMTIKLRYKEVNEKNSQLITVSVRDGGTVETSNNFRFSAAVAGFGMLLRDSKYKGTANYKNMANLARRAKGEDLNGYRSEFVKLVEIMETNEALSANR